MKYVNKQVRTDVSDEVFTNLGDLTADYPWRKAYWGVRTVLYHSIHTTVSDVIVEDLRHRLNKW